MIEVEIKLPIASPADLEIIRAELLKLSLIHIFSGIHVGPLRQYGQIARGCGE